MVGILKGEGNKLATGIPQKTNNKRASDVTGASNGSLSDVCLSYEGKLPAKTILETLPAKTEVLWQGGLENRLYFGDNLPILISLLNDPEVKGKVRLVYIDPPFATNSTFQSRSLVDAYDDVLTGPDYIEFLRQRLIVLKELMAEDGSIYVHLDDNMAFHIKVIMDEIFGRANFRNWITRKKCSTKNYTRKGYGKTTDFLLFYTKSDNYTWNRPFEEWTSKRAEKEYEYFEKETGRHYKKVPIHAPGTRHGETGKPWRGMNPPPGKHWQFTPTKLDELDARGEIYWSPSGNPRKKLYFEDSRGVPVQDIWLEFRDAHNQNINITGYPTEKNPHLLARIIETSTNEGDLVLDCFSGSGTTLDVASRLKRRWIGIDNSLEAVSTTLKRFAHGTQPMGDFRNNGTPFAQAQLSMNTAPKKQKIGGSHVSIQNFTLYAAKPYGTKLPKIVKEWVEGDVFTPSRSPSPS